eukprot:280235-Pyramimonas_sp.AAC.1
MLGWVATLETGGVGASSEEPSTGERNAAARGRCESLDSTQAGGQAALLWTPRHPRLAGHRLELMVFPIRCLSKQQLVGPRMPLGTKIGFQVKRVIGLLVSTGSRGRSEGRTVNCITRYSHNSSNRSL